MARARSIKPKFYKNEDLAECSIWARFIFPGLWQLADRDGRLEDRVKRIKAELLPYDEGQSVDKLVQELHDRRFVLRYEVDGQRFIQVLKFAAHQNPHHAEKASGYPPPPEHVLKSLGLVLTEEGYEPGTPDLLHGVPALDSGGLQGGVKRADSLNLTPITLNPNPGNGLAPGSHPPGKNGHNKQELRRQAVEILTFLNEKAGKHYEPVKQNVDLIVALLEQGATPDDMRAVIAKKCREWRGNPEVDQYLRPATLFGPKNFWTKYHGELGAKGGTQ